MPEEQGRAALGSSPDVEGAAPDEDGDGEALPEPGVMIGPYRLLSVLGQGAMGRVYKAEHERLGKKVALKMLRWRYTRDADAVERFFSEARAVAAIEHDNLVDVSDFLEPESWPPCFVMQYLKGRDLAETLAADGPLRAVKLLDVAIMTASAAAAVHDANIVHRDLKPANIFLARHRGGWDVVKLLDFGIAKLFDESGDSMHQTHSGATVGTPNYMAPEQLTDNRRVGFSADVWALGTVLFECATGRLPFVAANQGGLVFQILSSDPPAISAHRPPELDALPPPLEKLILQCLRRVPEQRPASMHEIVERLDTIARAHTLPSRAGPAFPLIETDPSGYVVDDEPAAASPVEPDAAPASTAAEEPRETEPAPAAGDDTVLAPTFSLPTIIAAAVGVVLVGVVLTFALRGAGDETERAAEPAPRAEALQEVARATLRFESKPSGAKVMLAGEAIGVTPLTYEIDRGDRELKFRMTLPHHTPVVIGVVPDGDKAVVGTLQRQPRRRRGDDAAPNADAPSTPPASEPAAQDPTTDREGLIKVF